MMKSSAKCDVEISITMAGEETVEPVPECLQGVFMASPSPGDKDPVVPREHVSLPLRYTQMVNCTDCQKQRIGESLQDREKDLGTALQWIKQEMILMKEQDKALMKQFISLRSGIVQLRCLYDSNSDLSSQEDSTLSLDDRSSSPFQRSHGYLADPDLDQVEFRERTSSLLTPKGRSRGPVTRIKWKSHEYI